MKKMLVLIVVVAAAYFWLGGKLPHRILSGTVPASTTAPDTFGRASSGREVVGQGVVSRILSDDDRGIRHQRFILRLPSGQTVLVAHNIDLAPRVAPIRLGDTIAFKGVFVWNDKGGVVHWTHRDPDGSHEAGWLKDDGHLFQ
ncbi:MAG TPA: DUF3465 domain-containing protein [Rhodanobacteraceae bacterium]